MILCSRIDSDTATLFVQQIGLQDFTHVRQQRAICDTLSQKHSGMTLLSDQIVLGLRVGFYQWTFSISPSRNDENIFRRSLGTTIITD